MEQISSQKIDPNLLVSNNWNPNVMTLENEEKLTNSIKKFGTGDIIARKLSDGTLEIIGGHHRAKIAKKLGIRKVPVTIYNNMSDDDAKLLGQVLNTRYGQDDSMKLSELLNSLENKFSLADITPMSEDDIDTLTFASKVDLDSLAFTDPDSHDPIDDKPTKAAKTHVIMRFKVPIADSFEIQSMIDQTVLEQGYEDKDSLTNYGDALVHLLLGGNHG